jgi:hypothetical protein
VEPRSTAAGHSRDPPLRMTVWLPRWELRVGSGIGRQATPSLRDRLQRRLEQRGAGAALRPRPPRLAHADVRIGRRLVEPGTRHRLLAAAPQNGDEPLETIRLAAARLIHRPDRSRRLFPVRPLQPRVSSGLKCWSSLLVSSMMSRRVAHPRRTSCCTSFRSIGVGISDRRRRRRTPLGRRRSRQASRPPGHGPLDAL